MTDQPAANADRELYREPLPGGPRGMEYYQPSVHATEAGDIGMEVGGLAIVRSIRAWHQAAQIADAVSQGRCTDCGHPWDEHLRDLGIDGYVPPGCTWPACHCHQPRRVER